MRVSNQNTRKLPGMLQQKFLTGIFLILAALTTQAAENHLVPRFIGETTIRAEDLVYSATGTGVTFTGRYQWWDHTVSYSLTAPDNGQPSSVGTIDIDMGNLSISGYDQIAVAFTPYWEGQRVTVEATVDGQTSSSYVDVTNRNDMHWMTLSLPSGSNLTAVKVTISTDQYGQFSGVVNQINLRNEAQYNMLIQHWQRYSQVNWDHYLKPESYTPSYTVTKGLYYSDSDIQDIRSYLDANPAIKTQFLGGPNYDMTKDMTGYVYPLLPYVVREPYMSPNGYYIHASAKGLAFAGIVVQNEDYLREAARRALILAAYESWNDIPLTDNAVGHWHESAFWPCFVTENLALALDYAGEILTDDGYKYILKALYKKGVAQINYSLYARPMYDSNQYVYFNSGRVAATLLMEETWPDIAAETDEYVARISKSIDFLFRPDGSFKESTGYLDVVIPHTLKTYYIYAKARGVSVGSVVPARLLASTDYADLIRSSSTLSTYMAIPIGDSYACSMRAETAGLMAMMTPGSSWEAMYQRNPIPLGTLDLWYIWTALDGHAPVNPTRPDFIFLDDTGYAASHRTHNGNLVKTVVTGNQDRGKLVDDIGSFSIEYDGENFALCEPNVRWGVYTNVNYYNMLVPIKTNSELPDIQHKNVSMQATGNATTFNVQLDLTPIGEEGVMTKWLRTIDSTAPNTFTFTDDYEVTSAASGVDFLWQTYLPVSVNGQSVTIQGTSHTCTLTAPAGTTITTDTYLRDQGGATVMGLPNNHIFTRIRIHKPQNTGILTVTAQFN